MKRAIKTANIYSALSIFIGPGIIFFAGSRSRGGLDCSDTSWNGVPYDQVRAFYHDISVFMITAASLMLVIGFILFGWLMYNALKRKSFNEIAQPSLYVLLMLLGYGLIIWVVSSGFCN